MKKQTKRLLFIALSFPLLMSCGGSSKDKEPSTFSKIRETGKAVKEVSKNKSKIEKTMEEAEKLASMEPIEQERLKEWLPKKVKNFKRTRFKTGELAVMGTSSFESNFEDENQVNKQININLLDGAGSFAATMIAAFNQGLAYNTEEEREYMYKKKVEKQGYIAQEESNSRDSYAKIQFIHNGRFLVEISGNNVEVDELWSFVKALPLNKLP